MLPVCEIGLEVLKEIVYLVLMLKSNLSCFRLYVRMLAANRGCTATTMLLGLFITENPEESLITTFENTVYALVAGGFITLVILKEKVPVA